MADGRVAVVDRRAELAIGGIRELSLMKRGDGWGSRGAEELR